MAFLAVKRSFCAILVSRIVRKPHFQEGAETMANTRQEAWNLIKEYNKEPFHRQHALTVEGCMRYFAKSLGYGDEEEFWGLVGLLHDLDYEKYLEECAWCCSDSSH